MAIFCRIVMALFAALYLMALAIFAIGSWGLFGQARDPLAGVYLVPLGWPWNLAIDVLPEAAWPWLAALAPVVTLAVLAWLCRRQRL
ncbi:hypothetical protein [Salipiger mucosus]|uniref:Uncharacterized protein n=1 Tax=Salipiger mucosus DSM 16094 TaxID=1123237 RepID=S9QZD6_9RHOB|nr:hypothetical protein [Salipiger mucosus]EPX85038.1 hypothetical protein Salmuc_00636 [Salipiger mucosus DSM 16094]